MHQTALPQLNGDFTITDGGLETDLIFHHGFDLPHFAAFPLVDDDAGRAALMRYYSDYLGIARDHSAGIILEAPTWRANPDWAPGLGLDLDDVDRLNRAAIKLMQDLADRQRPELPHIVVSGQVGPRGDGYVVGDAMDADEAADYHARQLGVFAETGADMAAALTMTYVEEAIGITRAAKAVNIPVAISFTVETDGRLPSGQTLRDAVTEVDTATDSGPAYFMINCAHPSHFVDALDGPGTWSDRVVGIRANASTMSHAELDVAEELDEGDPTDLGARHADLRALLPNLSVLGGCCGTDHRHVRAIASSWLG